MTQFLADLDPKTRLALLGVLGFLTALLLGLIVMKLRSRFFEGKRRWEKARLSARSLELGMQAEENDDQPD